MTETRPTAAEHRDLGRSEQEAERASLRRAPWWVTALGVVIFAVTVFYLTDSVLPPMLDTDVTVPAGDRDAQFGPGTQPPPGRNHGPGNQPPPGRNHGPGGGP